MGRGRKRGHPSIARLNHRVSRPDGLLVAASPVAYHTAGGAYVTNDFLLRILHSAGRSDAKAGDSPVMGRLLQAGSTTYLFFFSLDQVGVGCCPSIYVWRFLSLYVHVFTFVVFRYRREGFFQGIRV